MQPFRKFKLKELFLAIAFLITKEYVDAASYDFKNNCDFTIDLYDNLNICKIEPGQTNCKKSLHTGNGMWRHGKAPEATLAEWTVAGGKAWYDISIIPPGCSGKTRSLEGCKKETGKVGFNVPIKYEPITNNQLQGFNCKTLTCNKDGCDQAYQYPKDDANTHSCPENTEFLITFCPNNSNGAKKSKQTEKEEPNTKATPASPPQVTSDEHTQVLDFIQGLKYWVSNSAESSQNSNGETPLVTADNNNKKGVKYTNIGGEGSYDKVTYMSPGVFGKTCGEDKCVKKKHSISGSLAPMNEDLTLVMRGPMDIYNIAVYQPSDSAGSEWSRVSSYKRENTAAENMIFMNNKGGVCPNSGKWTQCGGNSQSFASADGATCADKPTPFNGHLDDWKEVNIMTPNACKGNPKDTHNSCNGFYRDGSYEGWKGSSKGDKMFIVKAKMPNSGGKNQPAIWMLNGQVVRTAQYGCNCRGKGEEGGCGELDIAEIIPRDTNKLTSTLYTFKKSKGTWNFGARPSEKAATFVVIFDSKDGGTIKINMMGENAINFDATSFPDSKVRELIDQPVQENLNMN